MSETLNIFYVRIDMYCSTRLVCDPRVPRAGRGDRRSRTVTGAVNYGARIIILSRRPPPRPRVRSRRPSEPFIIILFSLSIVIQIPYIGSTWLQHYITLYCTLYVYTRIYTRRMRHAVLLGYNTILTLDPGVTFVEHACDYNSHSIIHIHNNNNNDNIKKKNRRGIKNNTRHASRMCALMLFCTLPLPNFILFAPGQIPSWHDVYGGCFKTRCTVVIIFIIVYGPCEDVRAFGIMLYICAARGKFITRQIEPLLLSLVAICFSFLKAFLENIIIFPRKYVSILLCNLGGHNVHFAFYWFFTRKWKRRCCFSKHIITYLLHYKPHFKTFKCR